MSLTLSPRFRALTGFAALLGAVAGCNFGSTSSSVPDAGVPDSSTGHLAVLLASPPTEDFGTVGVGQQSAPAALAFENAGTAATGNLSLTLTGTDAASFTITTDGCTGQLLAAGAACVVDVTFNATVPGALYATLTATASDGGSATTSLTGTGATGPTFMVTPPLFDFGPVEVGAASPPEQPFTVTNTGTSASTTPGVTLGGANPADFAITHDQCSSDLVAGATCTFGVTFTPSTVGSEAATVQVSAASATSAGVDVTGTGLAPAALSLSPDTQSLGAVVQGRAGADFAFVVTNGGGTTTGLLAISLQGTNASDFALGTDGCAGEPLLAGASCTVNVHCAPPAGGLVGGLQAALQVSATPGGTAAATLTAAAIAQASLTIAPASQAMGTVAQGGTSGDLPFVVTNGGGVATGALKAVLTGMNAGQYGLGKDLCSGNALVPGASCTVDAHFTPGAATLGAQLASLSVSATPGGTASATLTGTAAKPAALTLAPGSQSFPATAQGVASADVAFTVSNGGGVPARGLTVTLGGANAGQFAIAVNGCAGQTLAPGTGSCTVTAHFAPGAGTLGLEQATLAVSGAPGGAATANLSGTATTPLAITPAAPTVASGAYERPGTTTLLTVTSVSLASVGPLAITVPAPFALDTARTTCSGATLTAASPTCTVGVYLDPASPSVVGPVTGTLRVSAGANTSASDALAATALTPATLTLSTAAGAPLPIAFGTVREKTPRTEAFVVTNTGAVSSGNVALAIGGALPGSNDFTVVDDTCAASLAPGAGCSFAVTFTPSTATTETATLTATTTAGVGQSGTLSGAGAEAVLVFENPNAQPITSYSFGGVVVSSPIALFPPATATFTLVNTGTVPTGELLAPGTLAAGYTVAATTCGGQILDSGARCSISITFQNATPCAEASTVLTLTDGSVASSLGLSATGISNATDYVVTSNPTDTTLTLAQGQVSPIVYTVTNCGAVMGAQINSIGHDDTEIFFPFPYENDSCTGATLGELGTCSFTVDATGAKETAGTSADLLLDIVGAPSIQVSPEPEVIVP